MLNVSTLGAVMPSVAGLLPRHQFTIVKSLIEKVQTENWSWLNNEKGGEVFFPIFFQGEI
jgi:hypothetical protein